MPEAVTYKTQVLFMGVIIQNRFETWRKLLGREMTKDMQREKEGSRKEEKAFGKSHVLSSTDPETYCISIPGS